MKELVASDFIKKLVGIPIETIGRASDMAWINFGEEDKLEERTLALHLQCPFRMLDLEKGDILFASYDIYLPKSCLEWSEEFEWDILGNNLYDEKTQNWISANKNILVREAKVNSTYDLQLLLSNNYCFETFTNTCTDEECWRVFEWNSMDENLVATGKGFFGE